jgi:hypothetical protein
MIKFGNKNIGVDLPIKDDCIIILVYEDNEIK